MNCPDCNQLAGFVEGLLDDAHRAVVEDHIDRCRDCRRLLSIAAAELVAASACAPVDQEPVRDSADLESVPEALPAHLAERFDVVRKLGDGAMGTVFEVVERRNGSKLALKILKQLTGTSVYQFKKEFRALADLRHPHLLAPYELIHSGDAWALTMELIPGVDFLQHVRAPVGESLDKASRNASLRRLHEALAQLCLGLSALHEAGFVHRDIKPSNVLVTAEANVMVLDFGLIADIPGEEAQTNPGLAGTVNYMSPEQAAEQPATTASDWYAVGTLLYQALTGSLPFEGPPAQVLVDKAQRDAELPSQRDTDVDPTLARLCMDLLARDPASRPDGREIHRRLFEARPDLHRSASSLRIASAGTDRSAQAPFVGRVAEQRKLEMLWERAREQEARCLVEVRGPPGIGKTALVQHFLGACVTAEPAVLVLYGRCHERESLPFKAFDALVDELTRQLRRLDDQELMFALPRDIRLLAEVFPVLDRLSALRAAPFKPSELTEPHIRRNQAFLAFRELLSNVSRLRPVALVLDDLQWADPDSLELLQVLVRSSDVCRLMALVYRDEGQAHLEQCGLVSVRSHLADQTQALPLGPLTEGEAVQVAEGLMDHLARGGTRRPSSDGNISLEASAVAAEAEGNPLHIGELVRFLMGKRRPGGDSASKSRRAELLALIAERLAQIDEDSRAVLCLLAVAGGSLSKRLIGCALGWVDESPKLQAAISPLREEMLVRELGPRPADRLEACNTKIIEGMLAELAPDAERRYHRLLAMAVQELHPERVDLLAQYWLAAGDTSRARPYLHQAAELAIGKLAFDHAAALYQSALDLSREPSARERLGQALGDALSHAGRPAAAAEAYQVAVEHCDRDKGVTLQLRAAQQWFSAGEVERGLHRLRALAADLGVRFPQRAGNMAWQLRYERARLALRGLRVSEHREETPAAGALHRMQLLLELARLHEVDPLLSTTFATRLLRDALTLQNRRWIAMALVQEASGAALLDGRMIDRGIERLTLAEQLARQVESGAIAAEAMSARGALQVQQGQWDSGLNLLDRAEAQRSGDGVAPGAAPLSRQWYRALGLTQQGRLRLLTEQIPLDRSTARHLGDWRADARLTFAGATASLVRGEPERITSALAEASDGPSQRADIVQRILRRIAQGELALYQDDGLKALHGLVARWDASEALLLREHNFLRSLVDWCRARSAVAVADREENGERRRAYLKEARGGARSLRRHGHPHCKAWAAAILATVQWQEERLDREARLRGLRSAIAQLEVADCRAVAAAVKRQMGQLLDTERGEAMVASADDWLAAQGVVDRPRFAAMLAPGLGPHGPP